MSNKKSLAKTIPGQNRPSLPTGVITMERYEGPLPHPSILSQYDQIVPGAGERIIVLAEGQARHRQEMERSIIKADITHSRLGLIFGFLLSLACLTCGALLIYSGHSIAGTTLAGIPLPTLAGVFVYGSRQKRTERKNGIK